VSVKIVKKGEIRKEDTETKEIKVESGRTVNFFQRGKKKKKRLAKKKPEGTRE